MLSIAFHNSNRHQQLDVVGSELEICEGAISNDEVSIELGDERATGCHCLIELLDSGEKPIRLRNLGMTIVLESGRRLHNGQTAEIELASIFGLGDTLIQIVETGSKHELDFSLSSLADKSKAEAISPGPETLHAWFESLGALQKSVAGSKEFFEEAARAIYNPGGLDGGMVLVRTDDRWGIKSSFIPSPSTGIMFREDLVEQAVKSASTLFHNSSLIDAQASIVDLHSAVVSPVLDESQNVVALVYGFRSLNRTNSRRGVRALEAQFVEVIADSVSSAMIRIDREAEAARSRVLLEHAFSPELAKEMETNPGILDAHSCEVSVLFADLRGFTSISERIGTKQTYELLSDLMDSFSEIIARNKGLIIDFYGDGISAFWNAPFPQSNHATLACQAALEMVEHLPKLNSSWAGKLKQRLRIGVGVNSGIAQVGNSGSRTKLKYGPRGSVVNLCSRLESATKRIGLPILISATTAAKVQGELFTQRVCSTYLKGFDSAFDLYQVAPKNAALSPTFVKQYASALASFESGDLDGAIHELSSLQVEADEAHISTILLEEALRLKALNPDDLAIASDFAFCSSRSEHYKSLQRSKADTVQFRRFLESDAGEQSQTTQSNEATQK